MGDLAPTALQELSRFFLSVFPRFSAVSQGMNYCIRNNFCQSSNLAVQNGFISRGSSGLPQLFRVAELRPGRVRVQVLEFLQTLNCFQSPEF